MNKIRIMTRPDTPLFVRTFFYWSLIFLLTMIDSVTLRPLFDILMNGNWVYSLIATVGVTVVLDVYSVMLPSATAYLSKKKQYIIFGIGLAAVILTVYITYLILRLKTGNAMFTDDVYLMDSSSSNVFSLMLALVPLASTFFSFYLSIHKNDWDKKNICFTIDELIRASEIKRNELESSNNKTVKLHEVDDEAFVCIGEQAKALTQNMKITARLEFAKSIGDESAINTMTANNGIISEEIISEMKSRPLYDKNKNITISPVLISQQRNSTQVKEGV